MNFRSISDMNQVIRNGFHKLPGDIELIVGIPRSGMLPATMLALYRNLPLTDIHSLTDTSDHTITSSTSRMGGTSHSNNIRDYKKILLIDDSCNTGKSMKKAREMIGKLEGWEGEALFGCVYATSESRQYVDFFFEEVEWPRLFEWNIMNHFILEQACLDFDGVLCADPSAEENDDGENYIRFLRHAKPIFIPKFTIGAIVTSRLEKYRSYTEEWLEKHHVKYEKLIMLDLPSKEERIRLGAHANFKAQVYRAMTEKVLFVESDPTQAEKIAEMTGKDVYCTENNRYISGNKSALNYDYEINQVAERLQTIVASVLSSLHDASVKEQQQVVCGIVNAVEELTDKLLAAYPQKAAEGVREAAGDAKRLCEKSEYIQALRTIDSLLPKLMVQTSCNGMQDYLEKQTTLRQTEKQMQQIMTSQREMIEQMLQGKVSEEGCCLWVGELLDCWKEIIKSLTAVYSEEDLNFLTEELDEIVTLYRQKQYGFCVEKIKAIVEVIPEFLDLENKRILRELASRVTDLEWENELQYIRRMLWAELIEGDKTNPKFEREIRYLSDKKELIMYPYPFTEKYLQRNDIVVYDAEPGLKYVRHNDHKLFFPARPAEMIQQEYRQLIMEQDPESPHCYFDPECELKEGDIFVDVGAAEGIISLDIVEKAGKIYLIECSDSWIEALKNTFAGYMDKIQIIKAYAGCEDEGNSITLDSLLDQYEDCRIFVKIDVEGMELDVLRGVTKVMEKNVCTFSCAVYHTNSQADELLDFFAGRDYKAYTSNGYMLFLFGHMALMNGKYDRLSAPYFRKGLVRAMKKGE